MAGKGSDRRPRSPYCSKEDFENRWDSIFGVVKKEDVSSIKNSDCTCKEDGEINCLVHQPF